MFSLNRKYFLKINYNNYSPYLFKSALHFILFIWNVDKICAYRIVNALYSIILVLNFRFIFMYNIFIVLFTLLYQYIQCDTLIMVTRNILARWIWTEIKFFLGKSVLLNTYFEPIFKILTIAVSFCALKLIFFLHENPYF